MEIPSKYTEFFSCLENLDFETNDSRLETLRQLRRISRDLNEAQSRTEKLRTRTIPSVQAAILRSESRLKVLRDLDSFVPEMFEIETKTLGELMREEAEEAENLG